jgi:hypothetical protein
MTNMNYQPIDLELEQLLLNPNNYRFLDMKEYVRVDPGRFHEERVQDRAWVLIELDGLDELRALKESIQANGYVPLEALVVCPYPHQENKYLVIEGNRRVAAMLWLIRDQEAGAAVSQELIDSFNQLPAIVLDPEAPEYQNLRHVLMGLRHVSGIKEWGGYQRARLVVQLVDEQGLAVSDAAKAIGMTSHEATRRYRAVKALEQMQQDEEFGPQAKPEMYRLFHEAVAQPKVREWLGWDDDVFEFTNEDERHEFYKLLIPYTPEDEEEPPRAHEPKIRTHKDVRNLREILGDVHAEEILLDPEQSLVDALAVVRASVSAHWLPRVTAALRALGQIPVETLKNLSVDDIEPLQELYRALKERLQDWMKLTDIELKL